jgi:hypothetical protein
MNQMIEAEAYSTKPFFELIRNRFKFSLFLLKSLPAAYFSSLKVVQANEEGCTVSVPFKWFTTNPFRSTYFACLAMAAEMSTGILAMAHVFKRKPSVSMLIVNMESTYYKKATGITSFSCSDGLLVKEAVRQAIETRQPQTIKVKSEGYDGNELIAEFWFTWSFKVK